MRDLSTAALIEAARARGTRALSEHDSKRVVAAYGVPVCREMLAVSPEMAVEAATEIGYPVVLKGCAPELAHKSEAGLVALGLDDEGAVAAAYEEITERMGGTCEVLVQEMVQGERELLLGMVRDPQFGPCVTFGLGGLFAEVLDDTVSCLAPFAMTEALAMLDEIRAAPILGPVRGLPPVDRKALAAALVGLGRLALDHPEIAEIDVNPVIVKGAQPIAVDALVVLAQPD